MTKQEYETIITYRTRGFPLFHKVMPTLLESWTKETAELLAQIDVLHRLREEGEA